MRYWVRVFWGLWIFWGGLSGAELKIPSAPDDHVWDVDHLFRNREEALARVSQSLRGLEENHGMEVYLVLRSNVVGETNEAFSRRCFDAWFPPRDEGLVIVLAVTDVITGAIGRSVDLYHAVFLEEGLMPRVPLAELQEILAESVGEMKSEDGEVQRVEKFVDSMVKGIEENLAGVGEEETFFGAWSLTGWLMGVGVLISLVVVGLARWMGVMEDRSRREYRFPDLEVPCRLKAPNGGGKTVSVRF